MAQHNGSMKVAVGSTNPVKIKATIAAFTAVFPNKEITVSSFDAISGVPAQPMDSRETARGARNRVKHCIKECSADYYIAFEGGVHIFEGHPSTFAVIAISNGQELRTGRTASLAIPDTVYAQLLDGVELGDAMDQLFNTQNIKHKGGAIGQLTRSLVTRESAYTAAAILTLVPFTHPELYFKQ